MRHVERIHERIVHGKRLGRHIEHDPESHGFGIVVAPRPLVSKSWLRHCPVFNQGDLGSCTGETFAGLAMTEPFFRHGRELGQADAVTLYEAATRLDQIPGHYPPDDTGSSGLAAARAGQKLGYWSHYRHAFGINAALAALSHVGPIGIGIGWYDGFDEPQGPRAELVISGEVRGGHELACTWIDVDLKLVGGPNSWGESWGDRGWWSMSWDTFGRLLRERGDVVVPCL